MNNLPYVADVSTPLKLDLTVEVSDTAIRLGSVFNEDQKLYLKAQITDLLQQMTEVEFSTVVDPVAHVKLIEIRAQIRCIKWLLQQSVIAELALDVDNN